MIVEGEYDANRAIQRTGSSDVSVPLALLSDLNESADETGCTGDLIVVSRSALAALLKAADCVPTFTAPARYEVIDLAVFDSQSGEAICSCADSDAAQLIADLLNAQDALSDA